MKKFIYFFGCLLFLFMAMPVRALENENIKLYFFHGDGCPHCAAEEKALEKIEDEYGIEVISYEVWYNQENSDFMDLVKKIYGCESNGVPFTVVGDSYISGYSESAYNTLVRMIEFYQNNEYVDEISKIAAGEITIDSDFKLNDEFAKQEESTSKDLTMDVPLFGSINMKKVSLSTAAVVIGLIDGFNPCAMWILLFLISMLIGMKNKKRMWLYGLTFLGTSALVYMVIMFSWLNIVVKVSTSIIVRNIIAFVAIIGGGFNLYNYIKSKKSGCNVVSDDKRKNIFSKIKKFTREKSLIIGLLGIIGLAISVNVVELACSAGLPLVFTQLLAINNVNGLSALLYTLLYILFFLFDDLIVFFVAMFTMKVTGFSTKYTKYSHLVGGILMILVGVLLVFKPEWLMFQFN